MIYSPRLFPLLWVFINTFLPVTSGVYFGHKLYIFGREYPTLLLSIGCVFVLACHS